MTCITIKTACDLLIRTVRMVTFIAIYSIKFLCVSLKTLHVPDTWAPTKQGASFYKKMDPKGRGREQHSEWTNVSCRHYCFYIFSGTKWTGWYCLSILFKVGGFSFKHSWSYCFNLQLEHLPTQRSSASKINLHTTPDRASVPTMSRTDRALNSIWLPLAVSLYTKVTL